MKRRKFFFLIPLTLLALLPLVIMQLWNHLITDIFQLKAITYWQAAGLFVLCRILFGNFGFGNGPRRSFGKRAREKWLNMTDEEKEKFKAEWSRRHR